MKLFNIFLWTFTNQGRLSKTIDAAQSVKDLLIAWCIITAVSGLILSFIFLDTPPVWTYLVLPGLGVLLVLIGTVDLRETGTDSLSIMLIDLILMFTGILMMPQKSGLMPLEQKDSSLIVIVVGLVGFGLMFGVMFLLVRAGLNRSFMFWPMGLCFFILGVAASQNSWLSVSLGGVSGFSVEQMYTPLLIVALLVFYMVSRVVVIRSFHNLYNTENFQMANLADFGQKMGLVYLALGLLCYAVPYLFPGIAHLRSLTVGWVLAAILELGIVEWIILSLWLLTRKTLEAPKNLNDLSIQNRNLLFQIPGLAFTPLGLKSQLDRMQVREGAPAMGNFCAALIFHTGYHKTSWKQLEKIHSSNPYAYNRIVRQIHAAVPDRPEAGEERRQTSEDIKVSPLRNGHNLPLTITGLFSEETHKEILDSFIFAHYYQAPRGRAGSPLAAMPLWFPVALPSMEKMTLTQIIYRSLASVREPFRRTRIVAENVEEARHIYTEMLDWGINWARSSFGASMIPIPLSLSRLVLHSSDLAATADKIRQASVSLASSSEYDRRVLYRRACVKLIQYGADVVDIEVNNLSSSLLAGNAWLLIEDDTISDPNVDTVKKAFDLIFNESALSHAAIIFVTDKQKCQIISDSQSFSTYKQHDYLAEQPKKVSQISSIKATLCRWTARIGSPSDRSSMITAGIASLAILIVAVVNYESLLSGESFLTQVGQSPISWLIAILALGPNIVGWTAAYAWGLGGGSEEVRRASVQAITVGMIAIFAWLLALLPRAMAPGVLKTGLVVITSLPGAILIGIAVIATIALIGDIIWHILSVRITRGLTQDELQAAAKRYRPVLHIAMHGVSVPLPNAKISLPELPLLVSLKTIRLIPMALSIYPGISNRLYQHLFRGLKQDFAVASLLIEAFSLDDSPQAKRCLEWLAEDCVSYWPDREEFGQYAKPTTSFTMNALEYVGRDLCYLTNMEELIVVR